MLNLQSIWCEKFRPQSLNELIIDEDNKRIIEKIKTEDQTPNLLFVGPPGTGKTSLAKIIVNDILKCQYLYINASDENGIDTIRTKVINFAQTKSFDGKIKVIILDECLHEDTLVTVLADGEIKQIPIKSVDPLNHLVKTYNFTSEQIEYRPFLLWDKDIQDAYEIEFENGEKIVCTADHKWYVRDSNNNIIRKKLKDIIKDNDCEIITKVDNLTTLPH